MDEVIFLSPDACSPRAIDDLIVHLLSGKMHPKTIVAPPALARRCVDGLKGQRVRIVSVVGYPLGLAKPTIKAIEATSLAKDDVDAIEVTPYPASVIEGDWDALRAELLEIVRGARAARPKLTIDVRVDAAWIGDRQEALFETVQRAACDGLIVEKTRQVPSPPYPGERLRVRG